MASDNNSALVKMGDYVASLYLSEEYSDMEIICGSEVFPAHRNIVCGSSLYFRRACSGSFKEGSGVFEFHGHNPVLLKSVLEYLYAGDYSFGGYCDYRCCSSGFKCDDGHKTCSLYQGLEKAGAQSICHFDILMYIQGDHFQIEGLKHKAKGYFLSFFKPYLRFPAKSYKARVMEIYDGTAENDPIRTQLVDSTIKNLAVLMEKENIIDRALLDQVPDFAADLCLASLDRLIEFTS